MPGSKMPFGHRTRPQRPLSMGTLFAGRQTISLVSCGSFRFDYVGEQYAGGLIAANSQKAAFGASAFSDNADLHPASAIVALAVALPVGALSTGVAVHDGDDSGIRVFRYVK